MRTLKAIELDLDVLRKISELNPNFIFTNDVDRVRWGELRAEQEAVKEARKQRAHIKASKNVGFQAIYDEAQKAGFKAGQEAIPAPMVVQEVGLDDKPTAGSKEYYVSEGLCGFAWVNITGNSKFGRWVKDIGLGNHDSYYHGVTIWCGEFGQSIARKEAWAQAFAGVLQKHGIEAYSQSRLD